MTVKPKKTVTFSIVLEGDFAEPFIDLADLHPNGRSGLGRDIVCLYLAMRSQKHFAEKEVWRKRLEHKGYLSDKSNEFEGGESV